MVLTNTAKQLWIFIALAGMSSIGFAVAGAPQKANNQFPFVKLLTGPGLEYCSSVCVAPRVVLTGWHCVHPDADAPLITKGNVKIGNTKSKHVILHPSTQSKDYPRDPTQHAKRKVLSHLDFAVVFFEDTVCSQFVSRANYSLAEDQPVTIVGMGLRENFPEKAFSGRVKRFADTKLERYGSFDPLLFDYAYYSTLPPPADPKLEQDWRSYEMLVTIDNNAYPMPGDSGGALLFKCENGYDLLGITSVGPHKTQWTPKFGLYLNLWSPYAQKVIDDALDYAAIHLADDSELKKNLIPTSQQCETTESISTSIDFE